MSHSRRSLALFISVLLVLVALAVVRLSQSVSLGGDVSSDSSAASANGQGAGGTGAAGAPAASSDALAGDDCTKAVSCVVRLATLTWLPYIGNEMPDNGYAYELVRMAFAESGYKLETAFYPWARGLRLAENADSVSGIFPEYISEARSVDFVFSAPFPGGPIGLYKRKDRDITFTADPRVAPDVALRGLADYRFGVVRGYVNTEAFDRAAYLVRDEAKSDAINLRKLYFGRIDIAVIDQFVANYLLANEMPELRDELEMMQPILEKKSLHIAFSRRDPQHLKLKTAFDAGLRSLEQRGEVQALLQKFGLAEGAAIPEKVAPEAAAESQSPAPNS